MLKKYLLVTLLFVSISFFGQDKKQKNQPLDTIIPEKLEEVVITSKRILGSKFKARNRTGSAYYISPAEIKKMGYSDINRMLKAVPGVNVYEEDGYGLRPNISLRGTKAERSSKITIMEDGILASPAPYSAPAAYYFPNSARMHAVEVLKGSSQVQYGPFTTGGAVNMVSTPIPTKFSAKLNASYGVNNTIKSHVNLGNTKTNFGYMVEYLRYQSDGFKKFEDNEKTGFVRNDFITKFLLKTNNKRGINHSLELKYGFANEDSDETYVGVSEEDFLKDPYLRYAGSRMDNMKTKHQQWVATYLLQFSRKTKLTTSVYLNKFHRNWYKLSDVRAGVTSDEKRSIKSVLEDVETNHTYFDILTGKTDYIGEALMVKANNRDYDSRGIQTKFQHKFFVGDFFFDTEAGLRYHEDSEDRFQWVDSYSMKNGKMKLFLPAIHGTNANRITSAKAFVSYALAKIRYNQLTVSLGTRYEDILLHKNDFGKKDYRRTGKLRQEITNRARVFIPSLGIHYKINPELSVFSGIHKGFSPPSAGLNQEPENSINLELGTRLSMDNLKAELIGFYNSYSNMLGSDLAASGGTGTLELFDVGKALVKGAEFIVNYQPIPEDYKLKLPIQVSYTYTDTEIKNDFEENSWGQVFSGDEIPYINKHSLNVSLGAEYGRFQTNFGIRYNGDMRTTPGQGVIAERHKVPAHTVIDASAKAKLNKHITLTLKVINLTNKKYLVSRHPSGLRAGHPFGIFSGVNLKW
ncbi:MAG: TonB-dependent receptor [Flavobacteriaceae bacterium]|nr:TonB-dependent receptor [Flavobacteriaceae bacterium]